MPLYNQRRRHPALRLDSCRQIKIAGSVEESRPRVSVLTTLCDHTRENITRTRQFEPAVDPDMFGMVNQASRLRMDEELPESLESALCSNWLMELEDELLELELRLSLSCSRTLAPLAFGEIDARADIAVPATELRPACMASMIARINPAIWL